MEKDYFKVDIVREDGIPGLRQEMLRRGDPFRLDELVEQFPTVAEVKMAWKCIGCQGSPSYPFLICSANHMICLTKNEGLKLKKCPAMVKHLGEVIAHKCGELLFRPEMKWYEYLYDFALFDLPMEEMLCQEVVAEKKDQQGHVQDFFKTVTYSDVLLPEVEIEPERESIAKRPQPKSILKQPKLENTNDSNLENIVKQPKSVKIADAQWTELYESTRKKISARKSDEELAKPQEQKLLKTGNAKKPEKPIPKITAIGPLEEEILQRAILAREKKQKNFLEMASTSKWVNMPDGKLWTMLQAGQPTAKKYWDSEPVKREPPQPTRSRSEQRSESSVGGFKWRGGKSPTDLNPFVKRLVPGEIQKSETGRTEEQKVIEEKVVEEKVVEEKVVESEAEANM